MNNTYTKEQVLAVLMELNVGVQLYAAVDQRLSRISKKEVEPSEAPNTA